MAILGFHFVTTLIGVCVLSKIGKMLPTTMRVLLLKGLVRLGVPSDRDFADLIDNGVKVGKSKAKRRQCPNGTSSQSTSDVLYFPRSLGASIKLEPVPVRCHETALLPFCTHLQWLLDFGLITLLVFLITESALAFGLIQPSSTTTPADHQARPFTLNQFSFNMSLLWLTLTTWFAFKALLALAAIYLPSSRSSPTSTDDQSSWPVLALTGLVYLLVASLLLALDDHQGNESRRGRLTSFNLSQSWRHAWSSSSGNNLESSSTAVFIACLALLSGWLASLLVFPSLKFARLYADAIHERLTHNRPIRRLLLHAAFLAPLLPCLTFIDPLVNAGRDFVDRLSSAGRLGFLLTPLFTVTGLRVASLLTCLLIRLVAARWQLQAYLLSAQDRLDAFNREPGRTSNKEIQRLVASIFYCFNLVALQLTAPLLLAGSLTLLYYKATPRSPDTSDLDQMTLIDSSPLLLDQSWVVFIASTRQAVAHNWLVLVNRFAPLAYSLLGYLTWWLLLASQSMSLLATAYYRFVNEGGSLSQT